MNQYLLHGKLIAKEGQREALAAILLDAAALVAKAEGCQLYVIGKDSQEAAAVYVTEIWSTKEDHDNSLKIAGVRELIQKAMPLLDGLPAKGQELEIIGGAGL